MSRSEYPNSSPMPDTNPMAAADAPARFRYSPNMLLAPSWVKSENRLTIPIRVMNAIAPDKSLFCFMFCLKIPIAVWTAAESFVLRAVK